MNLIAETIKKIVEDQGYLYFRSVNINDLNEQVGETDIAQGIGVYANLPEIENDTYGMNLNVLMSYSIEVYYLKLNNEIDDKGEAIDVLLDSLYPDAQQLYDRIRQSGILAQGSFIDSYKLDAVETLKMTKEVLTGWRVRMEIPIFRKDFYCEPINPPLPIPISNFLSILEFNPTRVNVNVGGGNVPLYTIGQQYRIISDDLLYDFTAPLQNTTSINLRFDTPYLGDSGAGFIYDPF